MYNLNNSFSILQVPSSLSSKKRQGKRGPKKKVQGRFVITEVDDFGRPPGPEHVVTKLVNHNGSLVRDHIPISILYLKAADAPQLPVPEVIEDEDENAEQAPVQREDVVADTDKDMIWKQVLANFGFPKSAKLQDVHY